MVWCLLFGLDVDVRSSVATFDFHGMVFGSFDEVPDLDGSSIKCYACVLVSVASWLWLGEASRDSGVGVGLAGTERVCIDLMRWVAGAEWDVACVVCVCGNVECSGAVEWARTAEVDSCDGSVVPFVLDVAPAGGGAICEAADVVRVVSFVGGCSASYGAMSEVEVSSADRYWVRGGVSACSVAEIVVLTGGSSGRMLVCVAA